MASHRRPKNPSRARVTVLTATAAAAVALTSQAAHADPKPTKNEVKAQVDKLYHEAEVANEHYNEAKQKQEKLEKQVGALQDKVARGQQELNSLRAGLGSLAAAQYRSGGIDPSVQLFLASDPDSFLDQASALDQLTAKQTESLTKIQGKQRTLAQERKEAQDKLSDLADVRETLGSKKKEQQGKLAAAQKVLNTLTAAERAKMREDDARASNAAADKVRASRGAGDRVELGKEAPGSALGASALQAAASRIGMPYQARATGPGAFDCSGLTQWAYHQAGAEITRTTYTQINQGTRISTSQLKPGDLVFFNGNSHVGLYAGGGSVLHAPYPGAFVRYESMSTIGSVFGAVRI
ncbi:cell wall-associated NlpC family hydrolase [Streptomyces sp. 840.1]|uniref:C40 family peptidase n=1 Tax=Streptomyces sp. 840.1 TaxID=2485152 RepID=UPI000FA77AB7|nr:C40 family peptidase [Streptomyces sp. 840.1]ROQ68253.1 cell wall-associated NlpC family hydrolase [Streptomyces sp. 840.1]